MKATELKNLSIQELDGKLADLKSELFNLRFQLAIKAVKKDIARVKTMIREKELTEQK